MDTDLGTRLERLEQRVSHAVERFRAADANPSDPFRGLYLTDEQADALLDGPAHGRAAPAGEASLRLPSTDTVLGTLAQRFDLDPLDLDLIVALIAPDLDPRFERLYGYLHDDLSRRRASVALALELSGRSTVDPAARARLASTSPLVAPGLVLIEERDRPFLTRPLRAPDRVVAHLLGDDTIDGNLTDVLLTPSRAWGDGGSRVARALRSDARLYLHERLEAGASGIAAEGLRAAGWPGVVTVDLSRAHADDIKSLTAEAIRECRLTGHGLICTEADQLHPAILRELTTAAVGLILIGSQPWDPEWCDEPVHSIEIDRPPAPIQADLWTAAITSNDQTHPDAPPTFQLGPARIDRAVAAASAAAMEADEPLTHRHLVLGARAQNSAGLARLARRIEPSAGWDDIVLDSPTRAQLEHLTARVGNRRQVLDDWGLRRGGGRGEGIIALFAGDSGTGKTLAAEIIARELDLELYVIDLSTVVDKYIGETEKNLDRIFDEAEGVNGILFFDEADALFGKRTEVSDAKDRYANVEVAYLLQRLETFDGLGVLATNLKANIDEAFARRLSVTIDFRDPDEAQRRELWTTLSAAAPIGDSVDYDYLAEAFDLTGGNIRNVVVTAAYLAASNGQVVEMPHLIQGTEVEYRKLGRLCTEKEFGPYYPLINDHQEI